MTTNLIGGIFLFLLFIVPGYVFISLFEFFVFRQQPLQNKLIASIAASYAILVLFNAFNLMLSKLAGGYLSNSQVSYHLGVMMFAAVLGFIVGKIASSERFDGILQKLGIAHSMHQRLWEDVIHYKDCISLYMREGNAMYRGYYSGMEDYEKRPLIAISHVDVYDSDNNLLSEYDPYFPTTLLIDTKDCIRIEVARPKDYQNIREKNNDDEK